MIRHDWEWFTSEPADNIVIDKCRYCGIYRIRQHRKIRYAPIAVWVGTDWTRARPECLRRDHGAEYS